MQQNAPASPTGGGSSRPTGGLTAQPTQEPSLISGLIVAHDLAHGPAEAAVQVQLERTLRSAGVERIFVVPRAAFDADFHHQVDVETTDDEELVGSVAREVRPGWLSGGRVLRAVDVVVWTR